MVGGYTTDRATAQFERALLSLCESKPLRKISVNDLLQETGYSRQTFYRKFLDKQDLINKTYRDMIMTIWNESGFEIDHHYGCVNSFHRMCKYKKFMKQAVVIDGQNCLRDYMTKYYVEWYENAFRRENIEVTDNMKKIIEFASGGYVKLYTQWAMEGLLRSPDDMAKESALVQPPELKKCFDEHVRARMKITMVQAK